MPDISLKISGMSCLSCAGTVEKALSKLPEVKKAEVQYATSMATIQTDSVEGGKIDYIIEAVRKAGYGVIESKVKGVAPEHEHEHDHSAGRGRLGMKCAISAILSLPLVVAMVFELIDFKGTLLTNPIFQLLLATPVQFWIGSDFYRSSFQSLRQGFLGMDILIAVGTTAAYGYSLYNVLVGVGELYFEVSTVVITLILLGSYLEMKAKEQTSWAIQRLLTLRPSTAILVTEEGDVEVDVNTLKKGDIVRVRPGDRVPADGKVLSGSAEIDESAFTGESLPVLKEKGSTVSEGTMCSNGSFTFSTTSLGEDTLLAHIVEAVSRAQNSKPPVRKLVDKISGIFVPIVLVLAVLSFAGWLIFGGSIEQALTASVAVLLISCPCALGLATPIAVVTGIGRGADIGVLFRNGAILEQAGKVSFMAFDKTNTLTKGQFSVMRTLVQPGISEDQLHRAAAAAERGSEHPIARAISNLDPKGEAAEKFTAHAGKGIIAAVKGQEVLVGNLRFATEQKIPGIDSKQFESLEEEGLTAMAVSVDKKLWGYIGISDTLRDEVPEVLKALHKQGISLCLISGDAERVVKRISESLKIDRWWAQVLPEQKQEIIETLHGEGYKVAMVGDGVNDAPALAAADLGIAMGEGTDVAIESADIALVGNRMAALPRLVTLSRKTMRIIRGNLFWAFCYNTLGIPLAMFGLLNPIIAGAAMALSSLSVVLNSLRLRRMA